GSRAPIRYPLPRRVPWPVRPAPRGHPRTVPRVGGCSRSSPRPCGALLGLGCAIPRACTDVFWGRGELREQPATGPWSGYDSDCPLGGWRRAPASWLVPARDRTAGAVAAWVHRV